MKNKIARTCLLLMLFLTGTSARLLAQIQNPPVDGGNLTPEQEAELSHLVWYKEPWLWIVATLLIVLVIVATRKIRVDEGERKHKSFHRDRELAD